MNIPHYLPTITELTSAKSRMLSSTRPLLTRFSLWIAVCLLIGMSLKVGAASAFGIPYKYKDSGTTYTGLFVFDFSPCLFYGASEVCPSSHKDPDGNNYEHGHTYEAFSFYASGILVTKEKSDAAWDDYYTGYVRQTSSSFLLNCYAQTVGAPTPLSYNGWISWSASSTLCDTAAKAHSYFVSPDHAKNYGVTLVEESCIISTTQEKNASSGVYTIGWTFPVGGPTPSGEKRKSK